MKPKDLLYILFIVCLYIVWLFVQKPNIFTYKFDKSLLDRYFLSQDIPREVSGKRLFLSDADVDLATGYLYAIGKDPSLYNFEHMPLIKYFYGFSVLLFNNPYQITITMGILSISLYYFFVKKFYNNAFVPLTACIFLIADPLFIDASSQTLFDLGQTTFMLLYLISIFYYEDNFIFQGIALGLFAAAKFWVAPIFFIIAISFYKIYKKRFYTKKFVYHLVIAFFVFAIPYTQSFILTKGNFNIFWHILKIFKYRFQHNTSTFFGASVVLFITGYLKTWWGGKDFVYSNMWSIMWPVGLAVSGYVSVKNLYFRKINKEFLISAVPLGYLFYLGVQAPFPRYFLIILPFLYMIVANKTCQCLKKLKGKTLDLTAGVVRSFF